MYEDAEEAVPLRVRVRSALEKIEAAYLRVLRSFVLLVASLLLIAAAWLAISSIYKVSRSSSSVVEKPADVTAQDIIAAPEAGADGSEDGVTAERKPDSVNPEHRSFYENFVTRYHGLFRSSFEPYRQQEDKQLSRAEFGDAYVDIPNRLERIKTGDLEFGRDKADLEALLVAMTAAASEAATQDRLLKYKNAKKTQVCSNVTRTRITYRRGWDSYSTSCRDWYESPVGCAVQRAIETPYTERVCAMKFPKNIQSHAQVFQVYQNQFFKVLNDRRSANKADADLQRSKIENDNADGRLSLVTAMQIFGGFVLIMFFFLLIAIERHQRKIAAALPTRADALA